MAETELLRRTGVDVGREIEPVIERILSERTDRAEMHGTHFAGLWALASECVRGGKLLRPRLLVGAFDALTASDPVERSDRGAVLEVAAALEILHFAFLLHDDLIDDDLMRRGAPNLIGRLASADAAAGAPSADARRLHWARSSALLVGDLMLTIAHQVFARARVPERCRLRMLDLLDATVTETVAGEHCDVGLADGAISPDLGLVLEMTRQKTATYTFELPLRLAAVIAESGPDAEQSLGRVGRHLGIAFQLQDDLLSAFCPSRAHGKDEFSDFREGKETPLIAYARLTPQWPQISRLHGASDFTADSGRALQSLLAESGAREFIEGMAQDQMRAATGILAGRADAIPETAARFLTDVIASLDGRRA